MILFLQILFWSQLNIIWNSVIARNRDSNNETEYSEEDPDNNQSTATALIIREREYEPINFYQEEGSSCNKDILENLIIIRD